jgi:hypothetical protein
MNPATTDDSAPDAQHSGAVCAVVVTWQPDIAMLLTLLDQLACQSCHIWVIDNGSANADSLDAAVSSRTSVTLLRWNENKGLAAAMNAGLRLALDNAYPFVFLFDRTARSPMVFAPVCSMPGSGRRLSAPYLWRRWVRVCRIRTVAA